MADETDLTPEEKAAAAKAKKQAEMLADAERQDAIRAAAKACKRPVPDTMFGTMIVRGTSLKEAQAAIDHWNAKGWVRVGPAEWGECEPLPPVEPETAVARLEAKLKAEEEKTEKLAKEA